MELLRLENISKEYKNQVVLRDVSLTVEEGQIYGLLGPNGAGKSTLLKIITGVIRSNGGQMFYGGKKWSKSDLRDMGAIIESPAIYPNLTARENLLVMTLLLDIEKSRIDDVLKIVSLEDTGDKLAKQFSLGMKQRLGIAMALINNPKLLILDEPTNGLDPVGILELRELMTLLAQKGITIILSSHILSEIQHVADKIGIIHNGYLCYEGLNDKDSTDLESLFMDIVGGGKI